MNKILLAFFASEAFAQVSSQYHVGTLSPGPNSNPNAAQLYEEYGQQPDARNTLTFTRGFNDSQESWTWRINVSIIPYWQVARDQDLGTPSADPGQGYVVSNIQWQLGWPGADNQSFEQFLKGRNQSVYVKPTILLASTNFTAGYTDSDQGDCAAVLGASCTKSIKDAAGTRYAGTLSDRSFDDLGGCEETYDPRKGIGGTGFVLGTTSNVTNNTTTPALYKNSTLFYSTSPYYKPSIHELSGYDVEVTAVHVLVMSFKTAGNQSYVDNDEPTVLCRVVSKDHMVNGAQWRSPSIVLWGMVLLCALALW